MSQHTYHIKELDENPFNIVIEKYNITHDFTLGEMIQEQKQLEKYIRQWESQVALEEAKMKNIEEHHPFVLDMSEQDMFTAHMYQESKAIVKTIGEKLPEFKKQLQESKEELEHVSSTLGIDLPDADEAVAEAVAKIVEDGRAD